MSREPLSPSPFPKPGNRMERGIFQGGPDSPLERLALMLGLRSLSHTLLVGRDGTQAVLDSLVERRWADPWPGHPERVTLTAEGLQAAENVCPGCGFWVPAQDGHRPPHPSRPGFNGGPRSWSRLTQEQPYWCPEGRREERPTSHRQDRQPGRGGKSTTFPRRYE